MTTKPSEQPDAFSTFLELLEGKHRFYRERASEARKKAGGGETPPERVRSLQRVVARSEGAQDAIHNLIEMVMGPGSDRPNPVVQAILELHNLADDEKRLQLTKAGLLVMKEGAELGPGHAVAILASVIDDLLVEHECIKAARKQSAEHGESDVDRMRAKLGEMQESLERIEAALKAGQDAVTQEQFVAFREAFDPEYALDTFDLALGFFVGRGVPGTTALDMAAVARDSAK